MLLTDNQVLVSSAKRNYANFKVAVCDIAAEKVNRTYSHSQMADLDFKTSKNLIGELVNLSQELNSIMFDKLNSGVGFEEVKSIYNDICKLNTLASVEIDSAKKEFTINSKKEIEKIKQKYLRHDKDGKVCKPYFFSFIAKQKGYYDANKNSYTHLKTSMDFLETTINKYQRSRAGICKTKKNYTKFYEIIDSADYKRTTPYLDQVSRVINIVDEFNKSSTQIYSSNTLPSDVKFKRYCQERQKCIEYIGKLKFSRSTMIYMLKRLDDKEYQKIYRRIFNILFGYPNTSFFEIIGESKEKIPTLTECTNGEICIFHKRYSKICKNQ